MFGKKKINKLDQWTANLQNSILEDFSQSLSEEEAPHWNHENQIALVGVFSFLLSATNRDKEGDSYRQLYVDKMASMFEISKNEVFSRMVSAHNRMDEVATAVVNENDFSDGGELAKAMLSAVTHTFISEFTDWQDNEKTFGIMNSRISVFWAACLQEL